MVPELSLQMQLSLIWQVWAAPVRLAVSSYARYCASIVLTAVALQGCCLIVRLIGCRMAADAGLLALHCSAVRLDVVWADLVPGCLVRLG